MGAAPLAAQAGVDATMTGAHPGRDPGAGRPPGRLSDRTIGAVGFLSFWDRFGLPPMMVVLAHQTGLGLGQVAQLFAVYTLMYAVGQPLWGLLSDRLGRVRVLRIALGLAAVASVASTLSPEHSWLLATRGLTGLSVGCLYPTMLTAIGDTRQGSERVRALSSLQSWSALGNTGTTLLTGTLAALVSWQLPFALTASGALLLLWLLRTVPVATPNPGGMVLRDAVRRWPLVVYGLAMLEGTVMLGILSYVVPAMQHQGLSVTLAGLLAATYGIGVITGAVVVRRLADHVTRTQSIVVGGLLLCAAFTLAATWGTITALSLTAALIGLSNAVLHVSLQGWATEVAPRARATSVSLFAASLFLGSSIAVFLTADLAEAGRYDLVFALSLAASILLTVLAAVMHELWQRGRPA
ncbi:MFS transporter [Ornithinimicrobium panacihumi]|uniref:MFS transporter n=1 Tax=Ornithinimicrobium panacihumi TaxID=2008449 RepID=UPI003F8A6E8B